MYSIKFKNIVLLAFLISFSVSSLAQYSAKASTETKDFRKFSFGANVGVLYPAVATGGANDYSRPQVGVGYGVNIKYQILYWAAIQVDFLRGTVRGNNGKYNGDSTIPAPRSFKTELKTSGSINGVLSLGVENKFIPYASFGAGLANYDVTINKTSNVNPNEAYKANGSITEYFVQLGGGLKLAVSSTVNLELGYRMHFVDGDNFDGMAFYRDPINPNNRLHRDKFGYGFFGLEFVIGDESKKQLSLYNP